MVIRQQRFKELPSSIVSGFDLRRAYEMRWIIANEKYSRHMLWSLQSPRYRSLKVVKELLMIPNPIEQPRYALANGDPRAPTEFTGKMRKRNTVLWLLIPANKDASKAIHRT
jgi:hypothetical protein